MNDYGLFGFLECSKCMLFKNFILCIVCEGYGTHAMAHVWSEDKF